MKQRDLFESVASFPGLWAAARRAVTGKHAKPASPPGSLMPNMPIPGACASRSFGTGGLTRPGSLVWCLTNTLTNLQVLLAVGCVALPRVVTATARHRALPTTKMPSQLHKRICETPHWPCPCPCVLRGGSWNNRPRNLRSANRNRNSTGNRNNNNGFRIASTLRRRSRRPHGGAGSAGERSGAAMMNEDPRPSCPRFAGRGAGEMRTEPVRSILGGTA